MIIMVVIQLGLCDSDGLVDDDNSNDYYPRRLMMLAKIRHCCFRCYILYLVSCGWCCDSSTFLCIYFLEGKQQITENLSSYFAFSWIQVNKAVVIACL